jgi:hypothetical protein
LDVPWICPTKQKTKKSNRFLNLWNIEYQTTKRMHRFDFLVFYTEHVWIFGILDKKQFGILVFWYFGTKPVTGPLHT